MLHWHEPGDHVASTSPATRVGAGAGTSRGTPGSPAEQAERAEVLKLFVRAVLALIVFVLAADVAGAVHVRQGQRRPAPVDPAVVAPNSGGVAHVGVGPQDGVDVAAYVTARQLALQVAGGQRSAVVSFSAYITEAAARVMLGGLEVDGFLVAARGGSPSVTTDLVAWSAAEQRAASDQLAAVQQLIPTVADPAYKADYRTRAAEIRVLLSSIDPRGAVVFAVVVRGPASSLQALARNPAVRLVDVGVDPQKLQPTEIRGLRPEEVDKVGLPPPRPTR